MNGNGELATGNFNGNFKREAHVAGRQQLKLAVASLTSRDPIAWGDDCRLGGAPWDGSRIIGQSVDPERVTAFCH